MENRINKPLLRTSLAFVCLCSLIACQQEDDATITETAIPVNHGDAEEITSSSSSDAGRHTSDVISAKTAAPVASSSSASPADNRFWSLAARPIGIGHAFVVAPSKEQAEEQALAECNTKPSTNPDTLNPDCVSAGVYSNGSDTCIALRHGHVPLTRYSVHQATATDSQHARRDATRQALTRCRDKFGRRAKEACVEGTSGSGPATETSFVYCSSDTLGTTGSARNDTPSAVLADVSTARFWAFAARRSGIGHAFALGTTTEEAYTEAVYKCNNASFMNINGLTSDCISVAAYPIKKEECVSTVHGFVPLTRYTAHFGRSLENRDPRATASAQAFQSCKAHWSSNPDTACRAFNGGASNGVKTHFSYCTSDVVAELAPSLPKPSLAAKYLNDEGKLLTEDDFVDQSPMAREIRKVNQNPSLNAIQRMKRILKIKERYGG